MREIELSWRDAWAVLRRRRHLVLRIAVVLMGVLVLAAFAMGPTYEATATLMVTAVRTRAITADADAMPLIDRVSEEDLNSQAELLHSEALIRKTLEPRLAEKPEHGLLGRLIAAPREAGRGLYRLLHGVPAPSALDEWTDEVAEHLDVSAVKKTNLIEVSYRQRDVDPAWAAAFVNALVDAGLQQQASAGQQREARAFFEDQRLLLGERVRAAESAQREFFLREGLDAIPEQRALLRERLAQLTTVLQDTETELAAATARVDTLARELPRHPETLSKEVRRAQNQAIQFLKPRILEKEMERNALLSVYAPTNDRVQDVERELAEARRLLAAEQATIAETTTVMNPTYQTVDANLAQATVDRAALEARAGTLRGQLDDVRGAVAHLDGVAAEHTRLEQELNAASEAYATYTKKQEQARLSSALDDSRLVNIAVMQPAEVPEAPARAHGLILLALGAMLSLCLGVAVAFGVDWLDPAVRGARDVELVTGLPVLAEIPS